MNLLGHRQRIITAVALLAVLAACLGLGGWFLRGIVACTAIMGLYEFYSLFWPGKRQLFTKGTGMLLGAGIVLSQGVSSTWILGILCLSFVLVGFIFLFSYGKSRDCVLTEFSPLILGLAYVPLILHLALYLSLVEQCLVLAAAIATDTGGFYAGSLFGRHKIWPAISPKKSIEGSLGGMALCILVCMAAGHISGLEAVRASALPYFAVYAGKGAPLLPLWGWALVGIALNIAAQMGDFFESALKRSLNVKDSGSILPGHGGVLDRIDSLLFVLPAYFLIRTLCHALASSGVGL